MSKTKKRATTENLDTRAIPIGEVLLAIPTMKTEHFCPHRMHIMLTAKQRAGLRNVFDGLQDCGATLEGGRKVQKPQDAIRWVLEQIAEESASH